MNKSQPQALKTVFSIFLPPTCCKEEGNQYQLHKRFLVSQEMQRYLSAIDTAKVVICV